MSEREEDESRFEGLKTFFGANEGVGLGVDIAEHGATPIAEIAAETPELTGMSAAVGGLGSAFGIAGGLFEAYEGVEEMQRGDYVNGGLSMAQSATGIGSGVAGFGALAGSGACAVAAPVLGALGLGLGVGKMLAPIADRGALALAHHDRAQTYAATTASPFHAAQTGITGLGYYDEQNQLHTAQKGTAAAQRAAEQLADYDDGAEEAIERSKKEHPERWGGQPRPVEPAHVPFFDAGFARKR